MRVIGIPKLKDFMNKHADSKTWIECWLAEAEDSSWSNTHSIKDRYSSVSFLSGNRVVFNVKGNNYRLICKVAYKTEVVMVEWIGTHAENNRLSL